MKALSFSMMLSDMQDPKKLREAARQILSDETVPDDVAYCELEVIMDHWSAIMSGDDQVSTDPQATYSFTTPDNYVVTATPIYGDIIEEFMDMQWTHPIHGVSTGFVRVSQLRKI